MSAAPPRSRWTLRLALLASLALFGALLPAAARAEEPLLTRFCLTGSGAGECTFPQGIATNPDTGHVYVVDAGNDRINEFDAWGSFQKSWGWGVRDGSPEPQTCGPGATPPSENCLGGLEGGGAGQLDAARGIALDSSGNLYVYESSDGWTCLGSPCEGANQKFRGNNRVQKFSPDGEFLLTFGREVNLTKVQKRKEQEANSEPVTVTKEEENLCTAASGDTCGGGVRGSGDGEFGVGLKNYSYELDSYGNFIGISPDDTIFVGGTERIQRFTTGGTFLGNLPDPANLLDGEMVDALAVDPSTGDIYVARRKDVYADHVSKEGVLRLSQSGDLLSTVPTTNPIALAVDAAGNLYAFDGRFSQSSGSVSHRSRIVKYSSQGKELEQFGEEHYLEHLAYGIAATSACNVSGSALFVSFANGPDTSVDLYGAPPDPSVCPPPSVAPTIDEQFATSVDSSSATLKARINPRFWPDTRYYVEYGAGKCSEGGCTEQKPDAPGSLLTKETVNALLTSPDVFLEGLQPATTYHYRFVAQSGGGGPVLGVGGTEGTEGEEGTFRTPPAAGEPSLACSNQAFRTGASARLPDCRAFELVSPLEKNNTDVTAGEGSVRAAVSGDRLAYRSIRAFADPEGSPLTNQYLAEREEGKGWISRSVSPPRLSIPLYWGGIDNQYQTFSDDLCNGWLIYDVDQALVSGAPPTVPNLYRRANCAGGSYELLTSTPPPGFSFTTSSFYFPEIQGVSADGSRAVFRANAPLAVEDGEPTVPFLCSSPASVTSGTTLSYQWLRDGAPILGAASASYTPREEDDGRTIQCRITATSPEGTSVATTEALVVAPVSDPPPPDPGDRSIGSFIPGVPTIAGIPAAGQTLTCTPGPWHNNPTFTYQWLANGTSIAGATNSTYEVQAADVGKALQCEAIGSNASGTAVADSALVLIEAKPPIPGTAPSVSGTVTIGEVLTCSPGSWSNGPTFAYQWLRNGTELKGAEDLAKGSQTSTYTVQAADEGKALQCRVTGTNADASAQAVSAATVVPPPPGTTPPALSAPGTITGTAQVGSSLKCNAGTWSGSPTFARKWLRNGIVIAGQTGESYELTAADRSTAIQCQVSATNAGGSVVAIAAPRYVNPSPPSTLASGRRETLVYIAEDEELRLVSVLPDGSVPAGEASVGNTYGAAQEPRANSAYHAVSDDGEQVFWTHSIASSNTGQLYLRLNATEPESGREHGAATGTGEVTGPATGTGNLLNGQTTVNSFKTTAGTLMLGQTISGEGIQAGTTIVGFEAGKLKISKAATKTKSGIEITGLPSEVVTGVSTATGAFEAGQEISGPGIPDGTTIVSCSPSCGPSASSLTLSAKATESGSGVALSATSPCTEAEKACTIVISKDPATSFVAANPEGTRVLYMTGITADKLYEAEIEDAGGHLVANSQLIASSVKGVMGASEDTERVYFASEQVLSGSQANSEGDVAQAGEPNLYFHQAGGSFVFVGTLDDGDARTGSTATGNPFSPMAVQPYLRSSRVSADGFHAAFTTPVPLTGADNTDVVNGRRDAQVFLFDATANAGNGELICASCSPSGARPRGRRIGYGDNGNFQLWAAAQLPGWVSFDRPGDLLSADGTRLFFNSYDALVHGDTNGRTDVYEWQTAGSGDCTEQSSSFSEANEGCVSLISSGESPEDSTVFDATADARDVFFATQSSLVPQDYGLVDVYDARAGGGFPAPPNPPAVCEGEACQGTPAAPNDPTPASSSFRGAGNVKEGTTSKPRCGKGKARKKGRCVKKAKKKSKAKSKRASHDRRNAR
jgi:hypothetical protein